MVKGVDLSCWNKNVDYKKLKEQGIEYAILRVGYGKDAGQKDSMFETHYQGCVDAGIKVGAYHYSYVTEINNAIKEAENCLNYLGNKKLDLPVFYDLEEQRTAKLGKDTITEIAIIFANKIKSAGYKAGVYANLNWYKNYIKPYELLTEDIKIWLAQWEVEKPTADFPYDFWQYCDDLVVGNIVCDGNLCEGQELLPDNDIIDIDICKSMAVDVIYGKYGNGEQRKEILGIYYDEVQKIVNDMYRIIKGD